MRNRKQTQILKELEESPFIERACKKVGIARSTFYRWCEDDRTFYYNSEACRLKGREKLNDFVESKLLENIKDGHQSAIQFWLSNNSKTYQFARATRQYRMQELEQDQLRRSQEILELFDYDEAIKLLGGDPEILNDAIREAVRGKLQWLVKHDV